MQNTGFLFATYTIVWAAVFAYVLMLFYRQKKLQREIDSLKDARDDEEKS